MKRNTSKEKLKNKKRFPYRTRINQKKYRIVDDSGKSYGTFRERYLADKTRKELNKNLIRDDLMIEGIE